MSAYFIAAAIATFFTRAGLIMGREPVRREPSASACATFWFAFGCCGLAVLLGVLK